MSMIDTPAKNGRRLKMPSHFDVITPSGLRQLCRCVSQVGNEFEKKDITTLSDSPWKNEDTVARLISYAKYLGLVTETRTEHNGQPTQVFRLTPVGDELKKILLFDPEKFDSVWAEIVKSSDLYVAVSGVEDVQKYQRLPKKALERLIYNEAGSERLARRGATFVRDLLVDAGLAKLAGEDLLFSPTQQLAEQPGSVGTGSQSAPPQTAPRLVPAIERLGLGVTVLREEGHFDLTISVDEVSIELLRIAVEGLDKKLAILKSKQAKTLPSAGPALADGLGGPPA